MSSEVSLSSVGFDELDGYDSSSRDSPDSPASKFHEIIFAPGNSYRTLTKVAVPRTDLSHVKGRSQRVAQNNGIAPMGKVGGEAGVTFEWGGPSGPEVSGYVSGSASDDKGNKAEVKVEVNGDGSGSASVSVSHDKDSDSSK